MLVLITYQDLRITVQTATFYSFKASKHLISNTKNFSTRWVSGASLSNWLYIETRCSAIAERPRCRVRYSFRQKWKTGTGRQYFTDIIGVSSTTVI